MRSVEIKMMCVYIHVHVYVCVCRSCVSRNRIMRGDGRKEGAGTDVMRKWKEAGEIAQPGKVPARESNDLRSIAVTYLVEGET